MGVIHRLIVWWRGGQVERDLDDEVRFHLGMRADRNLREGMSRDDAERDAERRFGDVERVKGAIRDARRGTMTRLHWRRPATVIISTALVVAVAAAAWLLFASPAEQVFEIGGDVSSPRPLVTPNPKYTQDAMRAQIQGGVVMTCIVQVDGRCTDVDVVESLDLRYGLDSQAQIALRQWRFEPGTRLGEPVPVQVTVEMTFTLR